MLRQRKISLLIALILAGLLTAGCSRLSKNMHSSDYPSIEDETNAGSAQSDHPLDSWIGNYTFSEFAPSDQNMFYGLWVYEENGEYFADISIDGFQTLARVKARVIGDDKTVDFLFCAYLPDNQHEPYTEGDILLSFERKDSVLLTTWGKIQPMLEENAKSDVVCFEPGSGG